MSQSDAKDEGDTGNDSRQANDLDHAYHSGDKSTDGPAESANEGKYRQKCFLRNQSDYILVKNGHNVIYVSHKNSFTLQEVPWPMIATFPMKKERNSALSVK